MKNNGPKKDQDLFVFAGKTILVTGMLVVLGGVAYNVVKAMQPSVPVVSQSHPLQTVIAPESTTQEVPAVFLVGGRIDKMFFADHAEVRQGDVLASLEKAPFEKELATARAQLKVALAKNAKPIHITARDFNAIEALQTRVDTAQYRYDNAHAELEKRRSQLVSGQLDNVYIDDVQNDHDAELQLERARRALAQQKEVAIDDAEHDVYNAAVQSAEGEVDIAESNLTDTDLIAPKSGVIASRAHEVGDDIPPGAAVYTLSVPAATVPAPQ